MMEGWRGKTQSKGEVEEKKETMEDERKGGKEVREVLSGGLKGSSSAATEMSTDQQDNANYGLPVLY